jgi:hypothetical protein
MNKLATRLTPTIKAWIKEEFGSDYYDYAKPNRLFYFPNWLTKDGFLEGRHLFSIYSLEYTEVCDQEFLAEFQTKKIEYQMFVAGRWRDLSVPIRIKPQPDYTPEIDALQNKAKENEMKVIIKFEKL